MAIFSGQSYLKPEEFWRFSLEGDERIKSKEDICEENRLNDKLIKEEEISKKKNIKLEKEKNYDKKETCKIALSSKKIFNYTN
jgi:hypothetical protein